MNTPMPAPPTLAQIAYLCATTSDPVAEALSYNHIMSLDLSAADQLVVADSFARGELRMQEQRRLGREVREQAEALFTGSRVK